MIFERNQFVCHSAYHYGLATENKELIATEHTEATEIKKNKRNKFFVSFVPFVVRKRGMTLTEMAVVIGIIAIMVGLTLPVANVLYNSFESTSGAKAMLNAALSSAKSIAIKQQRYAGIRFQKRYDPASPDPLNQSQYMIFIVQDPNILAYGFKAVNGIQPIKLPDSIGVMDMIIVPQRNINYPDSPPLQIRIDDPVSGGNNAIDNDFELLDTTAFSIIFSPSGKLVIHGVRVRNKDGFTATSPSNYSNDDIFNRDSQIVAGFGMFLQDDYWPGYSPTTPNFGLGPEPSRNSFYIYETKKLKKVPYNNRWTGYLNQLKPVYVSPYTGTIIENK